MTLPLPQLPLLTTQIPVGDPTTHRTESIPATTWAAIRAQTDRLHLPVEAVLISSLARTLADWSRTAQFALDIRGRGQLDIDAEPTRSLHDLATDCAAWPTLDTHGDSIAVTAGEALSVEIALSDGLLLRWQVLPDAFPDGLIDDLVASHSDLLHRLGTEPGLWTAAPAPERLPDKQARVRTEVNATSVPFEPAQLQHLFSAQAARTPDAVAVVAADRTLTYRQVLAGACALAEIVAGHRMVAVITHKGWRQVVAVLGILGGGAAYVPIAPDVPDARLRHLLRHGEITLAVTDRPLDLPVPQVVVQESWLAGPARDLPAPQALGDLAYVIYTSGSTGQPKGVMIDHAAAANTVLDINRRWRVGPTDRVFALSSLGFDLSVYDIFGLLAVGGAVVLPAHGSERAPWDWADDLTEHRVTVWNSVPALMDMLVTYTAGRGLRLPDALRLVLMSGDWIPVTLPDRIRALAAPGIELIGMGGATEASIWSNFYPIEAVDPSWPSIPYGKPLANQHFEVLDAALRRRPDWVPGELYIGGAGVAMGYWRDDVRTRASFITHPVTGHRLYRTGDLGRYLSDGNLEFLGREDFQVKIQGFRVELGEIEAALLTHPDVTGAVVTATDTPRGRRLVAYVTPQTVPADDLRAHLTDILPPYLLPDRYLALAAFPLTGNGKVDRAALPPIT